MLTLLMWLAFLYLLRELFLFLHGTAAWLAFGADAPDFLRHWWVMQDLGAYAVTGAVNGAMLIGWALYNQIRFRGKERRKSVAPLALKDLQAMYGFSVAEIATWQTARIVVIEHEPDGRIRSVETRPASEGAGDAESSTSVG
ncbi:MAG TPA: poly-beta-1,6-N-acetyl-D-glucosamine biosynthesis protein PgaD [Stellaceae bacterium]